MSFDPVLYSELQKLKAGQTTLQAGQTAMQADVTALKSGTDSTPVGVITMAGVAPSSKYIPLDTDQWLLRSSYPDTVSLPKDVGGIYHSGYTGAAGLLSYSSGNTTTTTASFASLAVKPDDSYLASIGTCNCSTNGRTFLALIASTNQGASTTSVGTTILSTNYTANPWATIYSATFQKWFMFGSDAITGMAYHAYSSDSTPTTFMPVNSSLTYGFTVATSAIRELNGKIYFPSSTYNQIFGVDPSSPGTIMQAYAVTGTVQPLYDLAYGNGVWIGVGANGAIYRKVGGTTPAGAYTTIPAPTSIAGKAINCVAYHGGKVYMAGAQAGSVYVSSDDGQTWAEQAGIFQGTAKQMISYGGILYILANDTSIQMNVTTTLDGTSWKNSVITGSTAGTPRGAMAVSDNYVYVAEWTTSSSGKVWAMPANKKTADWIYLPKATNNGGARYFMKVSK